MILRDTPRFLFKMHQQWFTILTETKTSCVNKLNGTNVSFEQQSCTISPFGLTCKYWPAGHVPLQGRVLGAPLTLHWHTSFDSFLLRLELLPLRRSDVNGLEVNLVLTVLHLWTWVTQDAEVQCTSRGKKDKKSHFINDVVQQHLVKLEIDNFFA